MKITSTTTQLQRIALIGFLLSFGSVQATFAAEANGGVSNKTVTIDGLDIFYREAGNPANPTILLLHGFPTSSHMFRNLIPELADEFHLVAPDYPGYGFSAMPRVDEFEYSFENVAKIIDKFIDALGLDKYSIYLMDYGAPIGFRVATHRPEKIEALIVQNGNAYLEGINNNFWEPIQEYWKDRGAVNKGLDKRLVEECKGGLQEAQHVQ